MADTTISGYPELEAEYELLTELGRGGMAVVYLARDRQLGREVAIKVIHIGAVDDAAIERQSREARTVAQLQHPNVVAIYAVKSLGTRGERGVALVMQYIPGRGLDRAMREDGPFTAERTEAILADIAAALAYAHARGVIHRDIKPENIFLNDETGRALLSDFGIALSAETARQDPNPDLLIGTPAYMSPEQIDDLPLDGRSDLFGLGLVGYEMLAGARPWIDDDPSDVLFRQRFDPLPSLAEVRPDVSERLQGVIERAIMKERDERWPSAVAMLSALTDDEWVPETRSPRATAAPRPAVDVEPQPPTSGANPTPVHTVVYRRGASPGGAPPPPPSPPSPPSTRSAGAAQAVPPEPPRASQRPRRTPDIDLPPLWEQRRADRRPWLIALPLLLMCGAAAVLAYAHPAALDRYLGPDSTASHGQRDSLARIAAAATAARATADSIATAHAARMQDSVAAVDSARASEYATLRDSLTRLDSIARTAAHAAKEAPAPPVATASNPKGIQAHPAPSMLGGIATNSSPLSPPSTIAAPAPPPLLPPPVLIDAPPAPTVVAGGTHACALSGGAGAVECWGGNDRGQLGTGSNGHATSPSPIVGAGSYAQISAGLTHTCGVTRSGTIECWGANDDGQLGDSTGVSHTTPARIAASGGQSFRVVEVGAAHTCALTTNGQVLCWGRNSSGQLGNGSVSAEHAPVRVASAATFVALAVGWNHSCALTATGQAYCWGDNADGELGDGSSIVRTTPVAVGGGAADMSPAFRAIAAGGTHTCALTIDGEAYCWGGNRYGQLGTGDERDHVIPTRVVTDMRFLSLTTGGVHTCAIARSNQAYCWGRNSYGQLGDGTTAERITPVAVRDGHAFRSINATGSHTCGRATTGATYCWGYNSDGQLGDGTTTPRSEPMLVPGT